MDKAAPDTLAAIRSRIDAIDEKMHRLLIERSGVIAELIRVKGASAPGAALRPDREADMMRRIALRHEGELPLVTVEHIWREIITTFTAMQAPFGIAAAPAADALALRDLIRFYFGFSIPIADCATSDEAIGRVEKSGKDVALVTVAQTGRWWRSLAGAGAPKIFAKLPFIDIPHRPADLPAYVIGPPLRENNHAEVRLFALPAAEGLGAAIVSHGGHVIARADGEMLAEIPVAVTLESLAPVSGRRLDAAELGGFFQPIRHVAERVA
jgi:chorismate mutase-like protein